MNNMITYNAKRSWTFREGIQYTQSIRINGKLFVLCSPFLDELRGGKDKTEYNINIQTGEEQTFRSKDKSQQIAVWKLLYWIQHLDQ